MPLKHFLDGRILNSWAIFHGWAQGPLKTSWGMHSPFANESCLVQCISGVMHHSARTTYALVSPKELLQVAGLQSSQCKLARPGRLDVLPPWLAQSAGLLYPWLHFQRCLHAFAGCSQAMRSLQKYTTSIMSAFRAVFLTDVTHWPWWLHPSPTAVSQPLATFLSQLPEPIPGLFHSRQGDLLCPLYST